eukprot:SAG31_NODE_13542_length_862_cov_8.093054_1_plen_186_part_10
MVQNLNFVPSKIGWQSRSRDGGEVHGCTVCTFTDLYLTGTKEGTKLYLNIEGTVQSTVLFVLPVLYWSTVLCYPTSSAVRPVARTSTRFRPSSGVQDRSGSNPTRSVVNRWQSASAWSHRSVELAVVHGGGSRSEVQVQLAVVVLRGAGAAVLSAWCRCSGAQWCVVVARAQWWHARGGTAGAVW